MRSIAQAHGVRAQEADSVAQQYAQGIVGSLVGGAPGTSIYGFGNNKGDGESTDLRLHFCSWDQTCLLDPVGCAHSTSERASLWASVCWRSKVNSSGVM